MNQLNKPLIALLAACIFGFGVITGMEMKAAQIRGAFSNALRTSPAPTQASPTPTPQSRLEEAKKKSVLFQKTIGDEIVLATGTIRVTKAEETQTVSSSYSAPKVAKEGTKFVIVTLEVTNTTKTEFSFFPDDVFLLVDNQNREYHVYENSIGALPNYLNSKTLSPSIKEKGAILYEIPSDATQYSLVTAKDGTNELYIISLK